MIRFAGNFTTVLVPSAEQAGLARPSWSIPVDDVSASVNGSATTGSIASGGLASIDPYCTPLLSTIIYFTKEPLL